MTKRYSLLARGEGPNYEWSADHTFVKVSAADTGGAYTLMEDNLKANFRLGLHLHKTHAETFYILEGAVDFLVDGDWMRLEAGDTLHIPPGVPHGCQVADETRARMLMIFQPAGFDLYLEALSGLTEAEFADQATMTALNDQHDIIELGELPPRP
ncbi:MAG: cupin domain-containing protein [Pseudomonadota bacterium]